jgi:translation elongation factor EF-Tu-like GTPase
MGLFTRTPRDLLAPGPFVFVVEEVFTISAVGPVLTGRVRDGWMTAGQDALLHLPAGPRAVTITRIESARRRTQQVQTGAQAGVVLAGLQEGDLPTRFGGDHLVIDSAGLRGVLLTA